MASSDRMLLPVLKLVFCCQCCIHCCKHNACPACKKLLLGSAAEPPAVVSTREGLCSGSFESKQWPHRHVWEAFVWRVHCCERDYTFCCLQL
jgi:hypothetical protein